jgi:Mg/Co/Ni transporter MgtE
MTSLPRWWRRRARENAIVMAIGVAASTATIAGIATWLVTGESRWLLLCLSALLFVS